MQHLTSGQPIIFEDVEPLVLATPHRREAALWSGLQDSGTELHLIGDALAPRTAEEAVLEGLLAGLSAYNRLAVSSSGAVFRL